MSRSETRWTMMTRDTLSLLNNSTDLRKQWTDVRVKVGSHRSYGTFQKLFLVQKAAEEHSSFHTTHYGQLLKQD